jgi:hypothetical protein
MAHMYDKAPPAFAKDPWAWDYTRDRMEQNTGLEYPDWQGKHFAGAAAMYKNVVKKYSANMATGNITVPKECVDCGGTNPHYVDDYVCRDCRDAIENAGSYHEAAQTISRPESIDAIREQLYKSLGHDKKDAKAGRLPPNEPAWPEGWKEAAARQREINAAAAQAEEGKVSRNYKAMGSSKLQGVVAQLEAGSGDAVDRVKAKGEDVDDHYEAALRALQEQQS